MKQTNEIVKLVTILQSKVPEADKLIAEKRLQDLKDEITAKDYNLPKDRISDVQFLEKISKSPLSTPHEKMKAEIGIKKIVNESHKVRSMRESLIKAVRESNVNEVKDISEFVKRRKDFQ